METVGSFERSERPIRDVPDSLSNGAAFPSNSTLSFMDRLTERDRHALASRASQVRFAAGSSIFCEGDVGDALYIVLNGQVAVIKEAGHGPDMLLAYQGPGEVLGEMSLVGHQPRSASVVAVEDTDLLRIDEDDFPALLEEHPGINWAILNALNDRLNLADLARIDVLQEEQDLMRRLERVTGEAEHLADLARVRQEAIELIVHDLRTPLAVIDGCLQMLRTSLSPEMPEAATGALELAQKSSQRLLALVEELLSQARREVSAALVRHPVDVDRLLRTVVEGARVTAEQSGIHLVLELPPNVPQPLGNVLQLERVVTNLVDNALSHSPDRGRIVIAAADRCGTTEISVTDDGPGVPAEHRQYIFERFAQVPGVAGRKQGFGLGLYFCRQVIEAHGGRIWVEPGPGDVGSRFAFTLPIEREATDG
jgi:signal transduction histidine kinase